MDEKNAASITDEHHDLENPDIENFDVKVRIVKPEESQDGLPAGTLCINVSLFRRYPGKPSLNRTSGSSQSKPEELEAFYARFPTKIEAIAHSIALIFEDLASDPVVTAQPSSYRDKVDF